GSIQILYVDRTGALWAGSDHGGVARLADPGADRPRVTAYTAASGLASNDIVSIAEDGGGDIYLGTTHGLDRLNVATGRVRHYTTAGGLPPGELLSAFRAHDGRLWFGTWKGVSRMLPATATA